VPVKGPHEECGFRLACGLSRLLLYGGGDRGTILPHGLQAIDGWHTCRRFVAALVEFIGIFLALPLYWNVNTNASFPTCRAWPKPSRYVNSHVNQSILTVILVKIPSVSFLHFRLQHSYLPTVGTHVDLCFASGCMHVLRHGGLMLLGILKVFQI
jgi:hypothetical protein